MFHFSLLANYRVKHYDLFIKWSSVSLDIALTLASRNSSKDKNIKQPQLSLYTLVCTGAGAGVSARNFSSLPDTVIKSGRLV